MRTWRLLDRESALALLLYSILSLLLFGRGLASHFTTAHIGEGADPSLMMWCMAWWPHALVHRLNPFVTQAIWAPSGFNLTWITSIPLIALFAAPFSATIGLIRTYNLLCLASLPLAGWCAFILCRYLSGNYWAALFGGYVFEFCPFLLAQMLFGRLHSLFIFWLPLALYLAIRRFRDEIGARRFVILLSLCLAGQFLCSSEIFATMTVFGAIALLLAWLMNSGRDRSAAMRLAWGAAGAYLAAVIIIAPYLYYMLLGHRPYDGPLWNDSALSADLLNFIIPTPVNALGSWSIFQKLSGRFNLGNPAEEVAFLGWPLMLLALLSGRRFRSNAGGRLMIDMLLIIMVCSLGPVLMVEGRGLSLALPWKEMEFWVLENAAPGRFCLYAFLILTIIACLWLASGEVPGYQKLIFSLTTIACLLPNLSSNYWVYSTHEPRFFRDAVYRSYIRKDESVLIMPFWPRNQGMLWQAQSGMYFKMAGGMGPWPAKVAPWPILEGFLRVGYLPEAPAQMRSFLDARRVDAVLIAPPDEELGRRLLAGLGSAPVEVGGVTLYRLRPAGPPQLNVRAAEARERFDEARFDQIVIGVNNYLRKGGALHRLAARNLVRLGLMPSSWLIGEPPPPEIRDPEDNWWQNPDFRYGMVLYVDPRGRIVLGESAAEPGAHELIEQYRSLAHEAVFIPPDWAKRFTGEKLHRVMGIVAMSVDKKQLALAAAKAATALTSLQPSLSEADLAASSHAQINGSREAANR